MGFVCAIQMTGLVRGNPKGTYKYKDKQRAKGKHRSNGKAVCEEMGEERYSSSDTLDKTRTVSNMYLQTNHSGSAAWEQMECRANKYKQEVKGKTKTGEDITRYRSLRKDAVIGVAVIINPPYEECYNWSTGKYMKFYQDTMEILAECNPHIFRERNLVFGVEHCDEGYDKNDKHLHCVYDAIDENGCYCGHELDFMFLNEFNKVYPERMRQRGWNMDDLDVTDWDRYKTDSEYKAERKAKNRSQGKSVNEHLKSKAKGLQSDIVESKKECDLLERKIEANQEDLFHWSGRVSDKIKEYDRIQKNINEMKKIVELEKARIINEIEEFQTDKDLERMELLKWLEEAESEKKAYEQLISDLKVQKEELERKCRKLQEDMQEALELQKYQPQSALDFMKKMKYPDGSTVLDRYNKQEEKNAREREQIKRIRQEHRQGNTTYGFRNQYSSNTDYDFC